MSTNNWTKYWQDGSKFNKMMEINTSFFIKKITPLLQLKNTDKLLDIGCGPGYLKPLYLSSHYFCGLDTSAEYIDFCKKQFQSHPNGSFYQLPIHDYLNFEFIKKEKFNIAIVFSVIQYYKDISEVKQLIKKIGEKMEKGGKLVIGDIAAGESKITDVISILLKALRGGYLMKALFFFMNLRFSEYYKLSKTQGLLNITESQLKEIIDELGLKAEILPCMTLQSNRLTLIVHYD